MWVENSRAPTDRFLIFLLSVNATCSSSPGTRSPARCRPAQLPHRFALVVGIAPWPLASSAQQLASVRHIASVHPILPVNRMMTESGHLQRVFLAELKQLGYAVM